MANRVRPNVHRSRTTLDGSGCPMGCRAHRGQTRAFDGGMM
jgi:hypothetical protein